MTQHHFMGTVNLMAHNSPCKLSAHGEIATVIRKSITKLLGNEEKIHRIISSIFFDIPSPSNLASEPTRRRKMVIIGLDEFTLSHSFRGVWNNVFHF